MKELKADKRILKKLRKMLLDLKPNERFDMVHGCYCLGGYGEKKKILSSKYSDSWITQVFGDNSNLVFVDERWDFLFNSLCVSSTHLFQLSGAL